MLTKHFRNVSITAQRIFIFLMFVPASWATLVVECGQFIDGRSGKPYKNRYVVITDGIISSIEEIRPRIEGDTDFISIKEGTCMPGLMDMHVHITSELNPKRFEDRFRYDPADYAYASVR